MEWYEILLIVLASVVAFFTLVTLLYRQFFKRFFDILVAIVGLIIASIPMMITAICVRIFLGKPVLFKQERVGRKQKHFNIYKFRTMTDKRDENGELLPDSERFTTLGKILRKTSLDELPQLFNVLRGDISLIGPRPMMPKYLPSDEDVRNKRFSIRPGITGLAQINGRTNITYSERFAYDMKYADHITFWGDIKIFFKTVFHVLKSLFRKAGKIRPEDMEMLKGTVEYDRIVAMQNSEETENASVTRDNIVAFETRPTMENAPSSEESQENA